MMKETGLTEEHLAQVAVVQREWAAFHPRATFRDPITVDDAGPIATSFPIFESLMGAMGARLTRANR